MSDEFDTPAWYDEEKLSRAYLGESETGWVVDLGDGTCRLANNPLPRDDEVDLGWGVRRERQHPGSAGPLRHRPPGARERLPRVPCRRSL